MSASELFSISCSSFDPFLYCFPWVEWFAAYMNARQLVHPFEILNDVMVVFGLADFRDTKINDKLIFGHQI